MQDLEKRVVLSAKLYEQNPMKLPAEGNLF